MRDAVMLCSTTANGRRNDLGDVIIMFVFVQWDISAMLTQV